MDNKTIEDVNINLQYQNDLIKKELIEKIQYVNTLENEIENIKNKLKNLEEELNTYKKQNKNIIEPNQPIQPNQPNVKNNSILNYIWNGFKN